MQVDKFDGPTGIEPRTYRLWGESCNHQATKDKRQTLQLKSWLNPGCLISRQQPNDPSSKPLNLSLFVILLEIY